MVIDFGNGIKCDTEGPSDACPGGLLDGDSGLETPDIELLMTENSNLDGGSFGGSRAVARRMVIPVGHDQAWTKRELQKEFTSGVLRTISTSLGSMPYYVEKLMFPKNAAEARRAFTVVIVSPLAYPLGDTEEVATFLEYTTVGVASGAPLSAGVLPVYGEYWYLFETFTLATDGAVTNFGPSVRRPNPDPSSIEVGLFNTSAGLPTTQIGDWEDAPLGAAGLSFYDAIVSDIIPLSTGTYALVWRAPFYETLYLEVDASASYAGGTGGYRDTDGTWITGFLADPTIDWVHTIDIGQPDSDPIAIVVAADSDVPCAPVITCTLAASDTALVVSDGTRTTTITHAFDADDVVVIDSDPANLTVTINGVDALAEFSGDFPLLNPGNTTLTFDPGVAVEIEWRPRRMGLI